MANLVKKFVSARKIPNPGIKARVLLGVAADMTPAEKRAAKAELAAYVKKYEDLNAPAVIMDRLRGQVAEMVKVLDRKLVKKGS